MARFKLLASQHITADPDWVPTEEEKANAAAAGRPLRAPKRVYNAVDVVESETDLVAKFGHQKFQLIGESKKVPRTAGDAPAANPANFPGGQVSSGIPKAVPGNPDAPGLSPGQAPMKPDEAVKAGGQPDAPLAEGDEGNESEADGTPDVNSMTVAELKEFADTNEIDLSGAHRRDEILKAIKKARKG